MSAPSDRWDRISALRRSRSKNHAARLITLLLGALVVASWTSGRLGLSDLFTARRGENLRRFLTEDALPRPLREPDASLWDVFPWLGELLRDRGLEALLVTFWIALAAMSIAGLSAFLIGPLGCRPLFRRDPYTPATGAGPWSWIPWVLRTLWVVLRAVPEYVWAFFLLAALGPNAWPAVLALALHNGAILTRLGADAMEDTETPALRALRGAGARRSGLLVHGLWPMVLGRYLLYAFYRFETCVREATVLGMLGIVSLGYWVMEARAHQRHDEMIALVILGALLVLAVDLASVLLRRALRRA